MQYSNDSLGNKIYDILEERILKGEYQAGDNLVEMKLAAELGVSRTPIREAVRQLEKKGLVDIVPNKGTVVVGITDRDLSQIYTIRMYIEGLAARWATENITKEQLEKLRESVELLEFYSMKKNDIALDETDSTFHEIIYASCGSKILKNILSDFHNYIICARTNPLKNPVRIREVISEHKAILRAIEEKDGERAEKLAEQHIRVAAENSFGNKNNKNC